MLTPRREMNRLLRALTALQKNRIPFQMGEEFKEVISELDKSIERLADALVKHKYARKEPTFSICFTISVDSEEN
jgi:hypothetical protein